MVPILLPAERINQMIHIFSDKFKNRRYAVRIGLLIEIQCSPEKMPAAVCEIKVEVGGRVALYIKDHSADLVFLRKKGYFRNILCPLNMLIDKLSGIIDQRIKLLPAVETMVRDVQCGIERLKIHIEPARLACVNAICILEHSCVCGHFKFVGRFCCIKYAVCPFRKCDPGISMGFRNIIHTTTGSKQQAEQCGFNR